MDVGYLSLHTHTHTHSLTHTHRTYNTYCFPTATMVTPTLLIVRFKAHCLSCYSRVGVFPARYGIISAKCCRANEIKAIASQIIK